MSGMSSAMSGAMTAANPYLAPVGLGLTILGGLAGSNAQQAAGQNAMNNALLSNAMTQTEADQEEQNAGQVVAAGQRQQMIDVQQGNIRASKAMAIMAASGATPDMNIVAGLRGQGQYQGQIDTYNANDKARAMYNDAALKSWSGNVGVESAAGTQAQDDAAGTSSLIGSVGSGVLSFASKYGGTQQQQHGDTSYIVPGDPSATISGNIV